MKLLLIYLDFHFHLHSHVKKHTFLERLRTAERDRSIQGYQGFIHFTQLDVELLEEER